MDYQTHLSTFLQSNGPKMGAMNLSAKKLRELCEGLDTVEKSPKGFLNVQNGPIHTCRPEDKYFVRDSYAEAKVDWGGYYQETEESVFEACFKKQVKALGEKEFYQSDFRVGQGVESVHVRLLGQHPWQALFVQTQFFPPKAEDIHAKAPDLTLIVDTNEDGCDAMTLGLQSNRYVLIHLGGKMALIAGTGHLGEIKKTAFTFFAHKFINRGSLPIHGAYLKEATTKRKGLFIGSSGVGKTTLGLSGDYMVGGDDLLSWSPEGVQNLEAGCYIKLASGRGAARGMLEKCLGEETLIENGVLSAKGELLWGESSRIENARMILPQEKLPIEWVNHLGSPNFCCILTKDAFGVLPPIAKLSRGQFLYHLLSGFSTKVIKSEGGIHEPKVRFSPFFAGPYLAHTIERTLEEFQIQSAGVDEFYLLNTGWIGGSLGYGRRIHEETTKALLASLFNGEFQKQEMRRDGCFGFEIPKKVPGVDAQILQPEKVWEDVDSLWAACRKMKIQFKTNFERFNEKSFFQKLKDFGPE